MKFVQTEHAPAAIGPYSQAVRIDGWIFLSGQIALHPGTGEIVGGTAAEQARQVMANLSAVLEAEGATLKKILKTTIFLKDMDDFAAVNEVYAEALGAHRPARATVEVSRLPKDVLVEIEAIAKLGL